MKEDLYATKVFKHDGCTLTVYQAKTTKVLLLTTMYSTVDTGDDRKSKPETVKFYNFTKFGVDVLDQMGRKCTVNATSRRWPVHFFYNILDLAAINAHILYKLVATSKISPRRYFLRLSEELRSKFVEEKLTYTNPVKPTAVCRKARNESTAKAKAAPTKHVKPTAVALSLFVINALENRKNSFIVGFAANKYWS